MRSRFFGDFWGGSACGRSAWVEPTFVEAAWVEPTFVEAAWVEPTSVEAGLRRADLRRAGLRRGKATLVEPPSAGEVRAGVPTGPRPT